MTILNSFQYFQNIITCTIKENIEILYSLPYVNKNSIIIEEKHQTINNLIVHKYT